nr:olfactory receptor 46 [Gregopimpla kuwanae]
MVLGVCSKSSEGSIAKQRAWAWAILMIIINWIPRTATLPFLWGNLNAVIECLAVNLSIGVSIAKLIVLQCQRRVIGSILDEIARDCIAPKSKEEIVVTFETAKTSRFISVMSVSLTNMMFIAYTIGQILTGLQTGGVSVVDSRIAFGCYFDSYFPFDTKNPIILIPIWLGQCFSTLLSMASYTGPDSIVSMMVLHLCGQLRVIRHSLKNLVNEKTVRQPKNYWKTLIPIVQRHDELNKLSFLIKETFSSILLVQMLVCSMTFCFQGYVMFTTLMDRNEDSPPMHNLGFAFVYAGVTVIHLFIYCYVGDKLLVESTEIPDDFYDTPWYDLAPEEAKAFLFVCHRSSIPLQLNAGKFCTFNLQLFNAIMKNSMGYLSMLMAMKDRLID